MAISSSCARTLNYIVVETLQDGEKCVEFLRRHNLGQASFMGLDLFQQKQNGQDNFRCPPECRRLFDLVVPKHPKYTNAFYSALRDTLVTSDLKLANKIAFEQPDGRKHRVVTLQGEIIEQSGLMSGGGKPKSGLMGDKIVEEYSE